MSAARLWRLSQALEVPVAYFFDGLPPTRRTLELDRSAVRRSDAA
jgi:hypothetical protein